MTPVELAIKSAYAREFRTVVFRPAVVGAGCQGDQQVASTAYLRTSDGKARLLVLRLAGNGTTVVKAQESTVVAPAGEFRVLVVLVTHDGVIDDRALPLWTAAQRAINEQHRAFADSRGYGAPIVSFENTNVLVPAVRLPDPKDKERVLAAAWPHPSEASPFDFVAVVNLDPSRVEGGFADGNRFVYIGNFRPWTQAPGAKDWQQIARSLYHHEIGHQWGWSKQHDWLRRCDKDRPGSDPFIVPAALFGWSDVDGDGIAEILDASPYGRLTR